MLARNAIARERGIAAYRAWVPFERIRPDNIPRRKNGKRHLLGRQQQTTLPSASATHTARVISYVAVILVAAVLLRSLLLCPS
jgi:hypothetical protein